MSFTIQIKEEISKINSSESELLAELSAYIRNNGNITKKEMPNYTITTTYSIKVAKEILRTREKSKTIMESHVKGDTVSMRKYIFNQTLAFIFSNWDYYILKKVKKYLF